MEDHYFKNIVNTLILVSLLVLSFFIIRPIGVSILWGIILAFLFMPAYNFIYKRTKWANFSAGLLCIILILLIILPIWFFTPIMLKQSLELYASVQNLDLVTPMREVFPSLFASADFSAKAGSMLQDFAKKMVNSLVDSVASVIFNFPSIMLNLVIVFFVFYFVLRDKEKLVAYIKSLLPFSKEVENKFFEYTSNITYSVLYGQFLVGILQGCIIGVGFFVFNVPHALILTLGSMIAAIFPVVGTTTIIWIPVVIYLMLHGASTVAIVSMVIIGIISTNIDAILRPMIVSRRVDISSAIIIIGMVGGVLFFGIIGFIVGPLVLSYLLIALEVYRTKKAPTIPIVEKKE
jgi:predicted PurR-regulated permease PerM